jgi:hypothetical protein
MVGGERERERKEEGRDGGGRGGGGRGGGGGDGGEGGGVERAHAPCHEKSADYKPERALTKNQSCQNLELDPSASRVKGK